MVQIVERVQAHYESREVPFGKVYEWHPASVAPGVRVRREGDP